MDLKLRQRFRLPFHLLSFTRNDERNNGTKRNDKHKYIVYKGEDQAVLHVDDSNSFHPFDFDAQTAEQMPLKDFVFITDDIRPLYSV